MIGFLIFAIAFEILGLYCIIRGVRHLRGIGSDNKLRRKEYSCIRAGILLMLLGMVIVLFKIVLNPWN